MKFRSYKMPHFFIGVLVVVIFSTKTFALSRIVALSPALTELVFSLGLEKTLVGVSDFSDFPEKAKLIPSVGPYTKPSLEKLISIKPDLILLPAEGPEEVKNHLDLLRLPYSVIKMTSLHEIGEASAKVAELLGEPEKGKGFQRKWEEQLKDAFGQMAQQDPASLNRAKFQGPKGIKKSDGAETKNAEVRVKTLVEVQSSPLIVAGKETFLDEIVSRCGGENIVTQKGYPKLPREVVFSSEIHTVFLVDYFASTHEEQEAIQIWKELKNKPQVIEVIDPNLATRPGPRLIQGIKKICAIYRNGK